jgi:hypothetical protein
MYTPKASKQKVRRKGNETMNKKIEKKFEEIAKEELFIETLETRYSDRLDFHDVSVWGVKKVLELAFELGKQEGRKEK